MLPVFSQVSSVDEVGQPTGRLVTIGERFRARIMRSGPSDSGPGWDDDNEKQ